MENTCIAGKGRLLHTSTADGHVSALPGKVISKMDVRPQSDAFEEAVSLGKRCLVCGFNQSCDLTDQLCVIDADSRTLMLLPACIACVTAKDWVTPKFRFDMWPNAGRWDFYNTSKIPSHVGRIVRGRSGEYSAVIFNSSAGYAWLPTLSEAAKWLVDQEST
jgi:hypothetical protein